MKTILVVDDEPKIVALVRDFLERAGYAVRVAHAGPSALAEAKADPPDLIILDLGLPGMDGLDVTREIRKTSHVPVIMLTARSEESDKLIGLELGADDYLTKPFSPKELVARVRALFRRMEGYQETESETLRAGDLTLDIPRRKVLRGGLPTEDLTATEFDLLAAMARYPGRVFTRAQLLEAIRGVAFESYERAIDTHIKNIRRKIEPDPAEPRYLLTVYGAGYRLAES